MKKSELRQIIREELISEAKKFDVKKSKSNVITTIRKELDDIMEYHDNVEPYAYSTYQDILWSAMKTIEKYKT